MLHAYTLRQTFTFKQHDPCLRNFTQYKNFTNKDVLICVCKAQQSQDINTSLRREIKAQIIPFEGDAFCHPQRCHQKCSCTSSHQEWEDHHLDYKMAPPDWVSEEVPQAA